jgi:hypothetical protein
MSMQPKLWTIGALAVELNRDPRTVASALKHTKPDGKDGGGRRAWFMTTATAALAPVERRAPRHSNGSGEEAAIDNVEAVWGDLRRGFENLEREPDVNRRRVLAQDVGPLITELESALDAVWRSDEDQLVFGPCRDKMIATAISELARLAELKMEDTPTGLALVVP